MALYNLTQSAIVRVPETSFASARVRERVDLQRLLRTNIGVIAPDTLVIAEEFGSWDRSQRRIDLLAVDKDANLVVIELKRDVEGAHMELQALRYAAMVARMTFDQAVEEYRKFLASIGSTLDPQASLLDFLDWTEPISDSFAQDVRIVLASADFSQELISTVLWLNDRDLDIRCVRLKPYQFETNLLLNVEQIVPLPEAADYQIQIRQKKQAEREASLKRREEPTLDTLVAHGVLREGVRLHLVRPPRPGLVVPEERAKHATFEDPGRQGIRWDYDGEHYSLSGLCRTLCERFGGYVGAGAFRGPDHWAIEGESLTLTEQANTLTRASGTLAAESVPTQPPNDELKPTSVS
ncbi:MAG TPA: hypothetical protein VGX03_05635 [Candidatus Binatia bacterium]|nr:hypothetical protein [Candidatus Binatia bacterium]